MNRLALAAAFSLISLTSPAALACRLSPDSEWNWPKEKLVQNTKQIAIAKLKQETETDLPNHGKQATFVFEEDFGDRAPFGSGAHAHHSRYGLRARSQFRTRKILSHLCGFGPYGRLPRSQRPK
jgi:hypothetical protein